MKPLSIFDEYKMKSFSVPKALFYGRYATMSLESKFYYATLIDAARYNNEGFLYVSKEFAPKKIIKELEEYELVHQKAEEIILLDMIVDENIVKEIYKQERQEKGIPDIAKKEVETVTNKQKKMMEEGFYNNEDLPPRMIEALRTFSESPDEANEYLAIILKAKKKVQQESQMILWIDNDEDLEQTIIHAFSRSIRKIKTDESIKNKNGYMYSAIYKALHTLVQERNAVDIDNIDHPHLYNWLEN